MYGQGEILVRLGPTLAGQGWTWATIVRVVFHLIIVYPDSLKSREKFLAFGGLVDSDEA
jgi:hypothetical protein